MGPVAAISSAVRAQIIFYFLLVFINLRDIFEDKLVYLGARQFRRTQFELHTRHAFAV